MDALAAILQLILTVVTTYCIGHIRTSRIRPILYVVSEEFH